jgi:hypothetical protein
MARVVVMVVKVVKLELQHLENPWWAVMIWLRMMTPLALRTCWAYQYPQ